MKKNKIELDLLTKTILIISGIAIIFSLFTPWLFTRPYFLKSLNFSETGQIGDTIGGILNPFIALVGVLLTFLAFYIQIKTNKTQIDLFKEGLKNEKEFDKLKTKKELFYKLSLLNSDLKLIIEDVSVRANKLKVFFESVYENPYITNYITRTSSRKYTRILDIDRLGIYQSFYLFLSHRENWIETFNSLYNRLDLLPELFDDIYTRNKSFIDRQFKRTINVRNSLIKLSNELSQYTSSKRKEFGEEKFLLKPSPFLANEILKRYFNVIHSKDLKKENQLKEIEDVLKFFIDELIKQRNTDYYDYELENFAELASNIRKDIQLIRKQKL